MQKKLAKRMLGFVRLNPTYICLQIPICDSPEGDFKILGEVKGGHPKGEFRSRLQEVLAETN